MQDQVDERLAAIAERESARRAKIEAATAPAEVAAMAGPVPGGGGQGSGTFGGAEKSKKEGGFTGIEEFYRGPEKGTGAGKGDILLLMLW